jgi:hypothetical protein
VTLAAAVAAGENVRMRRGHRKALCWGLLVAGLLGVAIFVGSRNLRHIDAALVGYTFAWLFADFGLGYRYSMWLQRPPSDVRGRGDNQRIAGSFDLKYAGTCGHGNSLIGCAAFVLPPRHQE